MKKYHRIQIVLVAVQLVFAFLLMIGEKTFLRPCGTRPDGTFMTCHWAGESVYVLSILLFFGAMLMLIIRKQEVYAALLGGDAPRGRSALRPCHSACDCG